MHTLISHNFVTCNLLSNYFLLLTPHSLLYPSALAFLKPTIILQVHRSSLALSRTFPAVPQILRAVHRLVWVQ